MEQSVGLSRVDSFGEGEATMEAEPFSGVTVPLDVEAVAADAVEAGERGVELFAEILREAGSVALNEAIFGAVPLSQDIDGILELRRPDRGQDSGLQEVVDKGNCHYIVRGETTESDGGRVTVTCVVGPRGAIDESDFPASHWGARLAYNRIIAFIVTNKEWRERLFGFFDLGGDKQVLVGGPLSFSSALLFTQRNPSITFYAIESLRGSKKLTRQAQRWGLTNVRFLDATTDGPLPFDAIVCAFAFHRLAPTQR